MENLQNRVVSHSEVVQPDVRIPKGHEMTTQEINGLVQEFRGEYSRLNPNPNSFTLDRAVADFKKRIVQASATVMAFDADMTARQAERAAAAKAEEDKREAAAKAKVDAENEKLRQSHLQTWLSNGGSEDEFAMRWPEMRLRLLEEQTLAQRNRKLAGAAQTWRG